MNKTIFHALAAASAIGLSLSSTANAQPIGPSQSIRDAMTFRAGFDKGTDADFAKGNAKIYTAMSEKRQEFKPGLLEGDVELAKGVGRNGSNALRFIRKSSKVVFYNAAGNMVYRKNDWGGTISFWLSLDPKTDLGDWYCDPIQITERAWNDAAIWVDFSKDERPKLFRLGVFADLKVWNPNNRDYEKMDPKERPMATAPNPFFARGKWTHITITFQKFNTDEPHGEANLYLDGIPQAAVVGRNQRFTWDPDKAAIQLGMNYVGLFDDLSIYNRALSSEEVLALHSLDGAATKRSRDR